MQLDDSGNIIDSGISVSDFTKKLIIPKKVREKKQKELFFQQKQYYKLTILKRSSQ